MKKIIMFVALGFILSVGVTQAFSLSVVAPAPIIPHLVDVEAIGPDVDPIIPEPEEIIEPVGGSTPLWLILAGYCKDEVIEYTEWSECNHNFGTDGFMYRDIVRPTLGNCVPTTNQQVATVSSCKIIE